MNYQSVFRTIGFILMLSIFVTNFAKSQWSFGPILDLNFATSSLKPDSDRIGSRVLWGVGVVADYYIDEPLELRFEPMYIQKGWKHKEFDQKYNASYIELPVLAKYNLAIDHQLAPYLLAGPSLGILLNSKIKFEDGDFDNRTDSFKKIDIGFGLGGGVELPLSAIRTFAEMRYSIGITDINDVESIDTKFRNRGLNIVLGIIFPITEE